MAFIVVQHLNPTHESLLPEMLARKTTVAVSLAAAEKAVEPDHVYVIPADGLLTAHAGLIKLKFEVTQNTCELNRSMQHHLIEIIFRRWCS